MEQFSKGGKSGKLECLVTRVVVDLARTGDSWAAETCETPEL